MDKERQYAEASSATASNLKAIARSVESAGLSRLSLPEIDAVVDLVAQMVPAGNVPGVILSGLARLPGRIAPLATVERDVNLLFKGIERMLDRAVYTTFFAGPAAVIWAYQHLLRLAGKDPEDSFPDGTWQFYADYALREDTARHACETHGFDSLLQQHGIALRPADRLTAWLMACLHCLHDYDALLENEWRERVYLRLLADVTRDTPHAGHCAALYRAWEPRRPYSRGPDADAADTYSRYRRLHFDRFLEAALADLPAGLRQAWQERVRPEERHLAAYQRQMSILAYLQPGPYGEKRVPFPLEQAQVCLIYQQRYYLFPACQAGTGQPPDVADVRARVAALLAEPPAGPPVSLARLARVRRTALPDVRRHLGPATARGLEALRLAPILFHADVRPAQRSLSELRQAERGMGDHALTVFDTGQTTVLDLSHIFFDGAWGASLAEILTNEALAWAGYLHSLPPPRPGRALPRAVECAIQPADLELIYKAPQAMPEVGAESRAADLRAMQVLRRILKQRNELLRLTVNDLLVLCRAIHAVTYQPDPELADELRALAGQEVTRAAALAALEAVDSSRQPNPAILIPVDASRREPRERVFPMTFEVPLAELGLIQLHRQVMAALEASRGAHADPSLYLEFDRLQRTYLATLAGFGMVLSRAKELAIRGESTSVGTIRLLAYIPAPLQRLLDRFPGRFGLLNDLIKGREVFSNVGAVAPSSTLQRFITAKDDNAQKTLAWGVLTDANGVMCITLRDFRPHVALFKACGRQDVARRVAQDYLDAYVGGVNSWVHDLQRIALVGGERRDPHWEGQDG